MCSIHSCDGSSKRPREIHVGKYDHTVGPLYGCVGSPMILYSVSVCMGVYKVIFRAQLLGIL